MSTPDQVKGKGQKARSAAMRKLVSENADRFLEIHNEERKSLGLFPIGANKQTRAELEAEVAALKARLAEAGIENN